MKIKRSQVHEMVRALQLLDQPIVISSEVDETTTTDGDKPPVIKRNNKVVQKRLTFDGKTRCDLARNLRILKDEKDVIDDSRQGLFQERATEDNTIQEGESGTRLKGKAALDFQKAVREMLNGEVDLPLKTVSVDSLKIDSTPIPLDQFSDLIGRIFTNGEP